VNHAEEVAVWTPPLVGILERGGDRAAYLDRVAERQLDAEISRALHHGEQIAAVHEDKEIIRVGGTSAVAVDVRVVCATNRDLAAEVRRGGFREDLFFRISAFTIVVPPLRERVTEIVPLAEHFLRASSSAGPAPSISAAAADALTAYSWPGNVRELRNAIERAVVVHTGGAIDVEDLPERVRDERAAARGSRLDNAERAAIIAALEACDGNQTHAAKKLGITRRALIYRMEQHGLKPLPRSRRK
jgi:DNA-binding NtrC family response regulator